MMKTLLAAAILSSAAPFPLSANSYYTARLDDPKAIYLTQDNFPVKGDGAADDSAGLQQAINTVRESTNQGILFVPAGRYRLTRTIYIWPGIRLIGFGTVRPTFVLVANTPGFQQGPAYMFFFAGGRPRTNAPPPDANPGTFYSAMSNIDLEIQDGNPGAVGVRAHYAQHCFLAHMDFQIGSGLAGIHDGGNVAQDVHFYGGKYGIWTRKALAGLAIYRDRRYVRGTARSRDPRTRSRANPDPAAIQECSDGDIHRSSILRRTLGERRTHGKRCRPRRNHQ